MRRFLKYFLVAIATIAILFIAFVVMGASKHFSLYSDLERLEKEDSAQLVVYLQTKVNRDNAHMVMQWLKTKTQTTTNFVVPLIYSDALSAFAKANKNTLTRQAYIDKMTTASVMYIFADATMAGDYMRCKDKTARAGITAIRAARFHPIYEFLTTEADRPTREKIIKEGFALEERIASRPPSASACAHGLGNFTDGEKGYITLDEWTVLRASTLEDMKKAYAEKFLPPQP